MNIQTKDVMIDGGIFGVLTRTASLGKLLHEELIVILGLIDEGKIDVAKRRLHAIDLHALPTITEFSTWFPTAREGK